MQQASSLQRFSDAIVGLYRSALPSSVRHIIPVQIRSRLVSLLRPSGRIHFDAERHHDFTDWEREAYASVAPYICQTPEAAISLIRAVDYVIVNEIAGDIVECGTYLGASAVLIAKALLRRGAADRHLYLYDTFEGMPKPDEVDVHHSGFRELDYWDRRNGPDGISTYMRAPIDRVRENVLSTGYPGDLVHLVKGMVEDTIPRVIPERMALLRLDTDYYASTKHELEQLYPRLSHRGVLIIDDYGAFAGARKATDEYLRGTVHLSRVDQNVRLGIKTV